MKVKFALICFLEVLLFQAPAFSEVLVVTSLNSPIQNLEPRDIKNLFLGNPILGGTTDFKALDRKSTSLELKTEFLKKVLEMKPGELKAYWSRKIFTGRGYPPDEVGTAEELKNLLKSDPLKVSFVRASEFDAKAMKILWKTE